VSTISVSGNYVVGSGQNLTFTDPTAAVYTLAGAFSPTPVPNFSDQGSIAVSSALSGVTLVAMTDSGSGLLGGSLIKIGVTGSLSVAATGSGASAYGYSSLSSGAAFENDGVVDISGVAAAKGVQQTILSATQPTFLNTGHFTVTGDIAWAVSNASAANVVNTGTLDAVGQTQAIAFAFGNTPFGGNFLTNSGTVSANASSGISSAVTIAGGGYLPTWGAMVIVNSGSITAQHAIAETGPNAVSVHLTNSGSITGDIVLQDGSSGFLSGSGSQIVNTGAINGAIHFNGFAADYFDGRGGTQSGGLFLGAGTGAVYLGADGETVTGGTGADAVIGGTGADTITGGSGADLIDGGGGNDVLTGGLGADVFLVRATSGAATITDFSHAQGDKIDLSALGTFASLSDVQAHAVQSGADTVITVGTGTLTLQNVLLSSLTGSDFTFSGASYSPTPIAGFFGAVTGAQVFSGSNGGAGAYAVTGALTDDGYILVQDSGAGDTVAGVVGGPSSGSVTIDSGASLVVSETGSASTAYGVDGWFVTNSGVLSVSASTLAVAMLAHGTPGAGVNNSGTITATSAGAAYGIQYVGTVSGYPIQITNSGTITAQHAISALPSGSPAQDPILWLTNTGTINGAIELGDGPGAVDTNSLSADHRITNKGAINGAIHLSLNGSDYYDGRGGTLTGGLYLAGGFNTVYLGDDGETVFGGYGGASTITGGAGADTITAGAGADTIDGGGGNDILTGGSGADAFVFTHPGGQSVITDFSHAQGDTIDLKALHLFFSLAGVLAASTQSGADTVIDLGGGNSITLQNVTRTSLTAADFVFAPIQVAPGDNVTIGAGDTLNGTSPLIQYTSASGGGQVTNNGALTATGNLVVSSNFSPGSALFTNNGQVSFQSTALSNSWVVYGINLINTGTITADFALSGGFGLEDGNLTNSGTMALTGTSSVWGVSDAGVAHPLYTNQGAGVIQVTVTGGQARGLTSFQGGEIDNAGTISVSGTGIPASYGIYQGSAQYGGGHGTNYALVNNSGQLTVTGPGAVGIYFTADFASDSVMPGAGQYNIINSGTLTAPTAIQFFDSSFMIGARFELGLNAGIDNSGTINGAVQLGRWNNHVLNTGAINGSVSLGDGSDTIDSHLGTINGVLTLGSGSSTAVLGAENNTVALAAGTHVVDGGGGTNTVSYASAAAGVNVNLSLQGQAQNTGVGTDTLSNFSNLVGTAFNDRLEGGVQTNTLTGGGGADLFVHARGGQDVITDFSHAQGDRVALTGLGFHTFADVLAAAVQSGSDTVINLGSGSLTLTGVTKTALTAQDFVLTNSTSDFAQTGQDALLFRNPTSGDWGYMSANNAGGETWHPIGSSSSDYAPLGRGDFNGDGVLDTAFRQTSTGSWGFLTINPSGGETWHQAGNASLAYDAVATGDILSNGSADIVFRNAASGDWGFMSTNGSSQVWHPIGATSSAYSVVGYGDFNGDGVFDVAFRNGQTGDWGFMSVPSTGGEVWHPVGSASVAYAAVASADFLGTGQTEIVFRNAATGDWGFMQANNSGGETWHPIGPTGPGYSVIGNGDFNSDGVQDVAFRNTTTGDWGFMTVLPTGGEVWHGVGSASLAYGTI